ncbi:hypothetical protein [Natronococcus jeotgali]|uniref:Uncharacterized protein n=1 Tax=Natronococcus jeotgali DSM 18795 TaxID=1227498 RepID=L9WWQ6_9EURY|nr:hypothetical protein [Natronococcus jeotgali]ELY52773.1 hypothetical protein C492_19102 [Natronococcus jeotgali DSM 18795]
MDEEAQNNEHTADKIRAHENGWEHVSGSGYKTESIYYNRNSRKFALVDGNDVTLFEDIEINPIIPSHNDINNELGMDITEEEYDELHNKWDWSVEETFHMYRHKHLNRTRRKRVEAEVQDLKPFYDDIRDVLGDKIEKVAGELAEEISAYDTCVDEVEREVFRALQPPCTAGSSNEFAAEIEFVEVKE